MLKRPVFLCFLVFLKYFNFFNLTKHSAYYSIIFVEQKDFFNNPTTTAGRHYEALRAFYVEEEPAKEVAQRFQLSVAYFKKLRSEFTQILQQSLNPFFQPKKTGPQKRRIELNIIERIVALRKQNYAITDIKVNLHADHVDLSLDTIDNILKEEGFAPLPKRTKQERRTLMLPPKIEAPRSINLEIKDEVFTTEKAAGPLVFLPLLEELGVIQAIQASHFPSTSQLDAVQCVLSFLALKLMGGERWSYDTHWNLDRVSGLFAKLNVLPKSTTLSTYSYRVTRESNATFLQKLSHIFEQDTEGAEFNLDFKAIPHWGDDSILEKNWCGTRGRAMKSLLSLIVQNAVSGNLSYSNAEIKHKTQNDAVLEFVDFWKNGHGVAPKFLVFDSKFTSYKNLDALNKSKEQIKFLTLRRRGKILVKHIEKIPENSWQRIQVERSKGKKRVIRVHDGRCKLRHYDGEVRQIIVTDHGRERPAFLVTNDFESEVSVLVKKYARRWLVEQEIAEQIAFFHLNRPSSSIVVKVDFDLTLSLLAHNLYRRLARELPGFENCTVDTLNRKFLENGAKVVVEKNMVEVHLKKKTHLPILFELPWIKKMKTTFLSWHGLKIRFVVGTVS